jgi:hypothetical protein
MTLLFPSRVGKLPYRLGLQDFVSSSLIWSKGIGELCDFAGPRWYRLAPTESTQPEAFFAEHYEGAHGLVWLRLGTGARDNLTCDLDTFAKVALPTITRPFLLITTDGDAPVPSDIRAGTVQAVSENPLLVAWYSQNCDGSDPVIEPFPIGLDFHTPRAWTTPARLLRLMDRLGSSALPPRMRPLKIFCDLNLALTEERRGAIEACRGCEHIEFAVSRVSQSAIWQRYASYPLVLSAPGNGLDCHRTWELLCLGCIVVTRTSPLDPLYAGLPVVVLEDWRQVRDIGMLARWVEEFSPLTDSAYIRQRLRSENWLRPLREKLASIVSPSSPAAPAS